MRRVPSWSIRTPAMIFDSVFWRARVTASPPMPEMVRVVNREEVPVMLATAVTPKMSIRTAIHCLAELATDFDAPALRMILTTTLESRRQTTSIARTAMVTEATSSSRGWDPPWGTAWSWTRWAVLGPIKIRTASLGSGKTFQGAASLLQLEVPSPELAWPSQKLCSRRVLG